MSCRFIRFVGDSLAAVLQSAQISAFNSARGRRHAADVERARVPLARRYNARWRPEWPSLQRIASTMDLLAILHSHKVARTMWPYIPPSHSYRKEKKKKKTKGATDLPFIRIFCCIDAYCIDFLRSKFIRDDHSRPAPLLNEASETTGWTTEVHRVGVTSGSSIVIFEAFMEAGRNSRPRRDVFFSPLPLPPSPLLLFLSSREAFYSHTTTPLRHGVDSVCMHAGTHTRCPPRNPSLNAYADEYRRGRYNTMSLTVSCMSRQRPRQTHAE